MPGKRNNMQQCLAHSKHLRDLYFIGCGIGQMPGFKRLFNDIYTELAQERTEAEIKKHLFLLLQCDDITQEERSEALYILQHSQTALTRKQQEQLNKTIFD